MRVVLQRSQAASVTIDHEEVGKISHGYVLLVGITQGDTEREAAYLAKKIAGIRLFEDEQGRMNRSLHEVKGQVLSISQFTLFADTKKGRRPSFMAAAKTEIAKPLWEQFNEYLQAEGLIVETGKFGAMMDIKLVNDGPVTILFDTNE